MKRLSALLCAAVLAATLPMPAHAAEPAPTDVRLAWKDSTYQQVLVTWDETGQLPNTVVIRKAGTDVVRRTVQVAADAPNVVELPAQLLWVYGGSSGTLEIAVAVGTADGITSPQAVSAAFDTDRPAAPRLVSSAITGPSTIAAHWKAGTRPDSTPGDPLDVTVPDVFQATAGGVEVSPKGPGTSATVTGTTPTFDVSVTAFNEWNSTTASVVHVGSSAPALAEPATATYGFTFNLFGGFAGQTARPVILQARNTPTSPWYVVGSRTFSGSQYLFWLQNSAPRQYRVQIPNVAGGPHVWFGGYSPVRTSQVRLNVNAGLPYPTVRRGELEAVTLTVYPLAELTAVLQRWNGKAWTTVGPVKADAGTAYGYVRHPVPGKYSYRYYVPNTVYRGATYLAAYSEPTVLTVT